MVVVEGKVTLAVTRPDKSEEGSMSAACLINARDTSAHCTECPTASTQSIYFLSL